MLTASMMLTASILMGGPVPGRKMLQRILLRVWEDGQRPALDRESHELTSIVLQLVGQRLEHLKAITVGDLGDVTSSGLLDLASIAAHGMKFGEWRKRSELQKSAQAWELGQLTRSMVPDYDPEVDKASKMGRQAAWPRPLYEMPSKEVGKKQELMREVPKDTEEAV